MCKNSHGNFKIYFLSLDKLQTGLDLHFSYLFKFFKSLLLKTLMHTLMGKLALLVLTSKPSVISEWSH